MPRRRRTGSKRSIEEVILESTVPTNIPPPQQSLHRTGPAIGLLTGVATAPGGLASPSAMGGAGPTLPLTLPEPPLSMAIPANPNALQSDPQPRPKKKSKYSAEQDQIILQLKKEGKSWSEIAEKAKCGNSLAARNRYQVLIGQQGGGAVVWEAEDAMGLKSLLEEGEKAKWDYIASELSRLRSKNITAHACQSKIKELFDADPSRFGVVIGANAMAPFGPGSYGAQPPPTPMGSYGGGYPQWPSYGQVPGLPQSQPPLQPPQAPIGPGQPTSSVYHSDIDYGQSMPYSSNVQEFMRR